MEITEITAYKVLRQVSTPEIGTLVSAVVKTPGWEHCYGNAYSVPQVTLQETECPRMFIFLSQEEAFNWVEEADLDTENNFLEIWEVTAYNPFKALISFSRTTQAIWKKRPNASGKP